MISIVCIFNNKDILNNYLLKGLDNQTIDYELILLEHSKYDFKSAAEALNHGGSMAEGDYIIFAHQDVKFDSDTWIEDAEKFLDKLPELGVAGIAGKSESCREVITNVKHGDNPHFAGKVQIEKPVEVQTLDECLLMIPKQVFQSIKFDEKTCDGWHLYGVDYCLTVKTVDLAVYVLPLPIFHRSSGDPFSKEYYTILGKLFEKHRDNYRIIHTTVSDWNTRYSVTAQQTMFWLENKVYSGFKNRFLKISGDKK